MTKGKRILRIANVFFREFLTTGPKCYEVSKEPLPADALVVFAQMGDYGRTMEVVLESEEWPALEDSERIPEIAPIMKRIDSPFPADRPPDQPNPPVK